MQGYNLGDTIVASASAPAQQAIAVVRLSGESAWRIAQGCLREMAIPQPQHAIVCSLNLRAAEQPFSDRAVITYWQAPHTYTGEDVVELSVHGSPVIVRLLLDLCKQLGARLAEAGEFTFRAFANGKLDLAQAEAVQELISAGSERALSLAGSSLAGRTSTQAQAWGEQLTRLLAAVEAFHDYAADDLDASIAIRDLPTPETLYNELSGLERELSAAIAASQQVLPWREGVSVAILGPPNVGKSTLFNALLGQPRALTAPQPGTTRDYLSEALDVCGLKLSLIDTAGYREAFDCVEAAGIARSEEWGKAADYVLWVTAADCEPVPPPAFLAAAALLEVRTRCDLLPSWPDASEPGACCVSGLTGRGIEDLRAHLSADSGDLLDSSFAMFNRRQLGQLNAAQSAVRNAMTALEHSMPLDAVCQDLYTARQALAGVYTQDDHGEVVNTIFSSFCVGK